MEIYLDYSTTVEKALSEIDPNYLDYPGFVICGTHAPRDVEKMIELIRQCRLTKTPLLGICFGHQLCAIEWARANGIPDATSEEFGKGTWVVKKRPSLKVGLHDGETYWNWYEVDIENLNGIEKDFEFVERDGTIETLRLKNHPFFMTTQFHSEYQSSKDRPHPILKEFLEVCSTLK